MKRFLKRYRGLTLIVLAALLLELISAIQYYYMHDILTDELEKKAELEMMMKTAFTKNTLNMAENSLQGHVWDFKRNFSQPDSIYSATEWVLRSHPNITGCSIAFIPDFFKDKGRLFEPFAYWKDGEVVKEQIAGEDHDYTNGVIFQNVCQTNKPVWTDPYMDDFTGKRLATYARPLHDDAQQTVAVFALDMALDWLGDTLNYRHIYPSSYAILLTESGKMVAEPRDTIAKWQDVEKVISIINDSTAEKSWSRSGKVRTFSFTSVNGDEGIVFYHFFKGTPHWQIAVVYYEDEIYGTVRQARVNTLLLMLTGFSVLGFIVWLFFRSEKKLKHTQLKQERIDSELHIARRIQMEMLPSNIEAGPASEQASRSDVNVYGKLVPAKEVGGDLFDFFQRDGKLFFCIGDVSGKGVPSALVMAVTRSQFRMAAAHQNNPAHIMQTINETACEGNESCMFVTLFIGVFDLSTGRLHYCNAGHDAPFIISHEKLVASHYLLPVESNLPVGVLADFEYKPQETTIAPGATLFLYTDGLTEAKNAAHEQFGLKRIEQVLDGLQQVSPQQLTEVMTHQVHLFVKEAEQSDDLTMLTIGYTPTASREEQH